MILNEKYWENRYLDNEIGWDLGKPAPSLTNYFDQLTDNNIRILIPGAGNAYEIEYLWNAGFKNIVVLDIAETPLKNFKRRLPDFPKTNIHQVDFFDHHGSYDLIVEQTFFCALDPKLRSKYMNKMNELLKENAKLVGLLFNRDFGNNYPPFGGSFEEYQNLLCKNFTIKILETSYNSVQPRIGTELFFIVIKKTM